MFPPENIHFLYSVSTHLPPHHPQQPPSANPIPHIPIPPMTTVPTYAHRCNRLSLDATCRKPSTLESLSAFFGVMQPDNRMSPTPFSEIRDLFRNNPRSETSRAITVKETDEPRNRRVQTDTESCNEPKNKLNSKTHRYECSNLCKGLINRRPSINRETGDGPVRLCRQERSHSPTGL